MQTKRMLKDSGRKRVTEIVSVLFLVIALGLLAGCGQKESGNTGTRVSSDSVSKSAPVPNELTEVRVALAGAISDSGILLADQRGYFKDEGIKLSLKREPINSSMLRLAGGDLDIAGGSISAAFLSAVSRGAHLKIISEKASITPGVPAYGVLVAAKDSGVDKIQQLKDKNVGVYSIAGYPSFILSRILERVNMSLDDVHLRVMNGPTMLQALAGGAIPAGILFEPSLAEAQRKGFVKIIAEPEDQNIVAGLLMASPEFLKNKELLIRFLRAYLRGVRDYDKAFFAVPNVGRQEVIRDLISDPLITIKSPELYASMRYPYINPNGELNMEALQEQVTYYYETGQVAGQSRLSAKEVTDLEYVHEAAKSLGLSDIRISR